MVVAVMGAGYLAPRRRSRNSGGPQANSELTLSELWIRLMASPRRRAIESCLIFGQALALSERAMESLTTTSASGDSAMRWTAGPDSTPWLAHATTLRAPFSARAVAAPQRVPAVSMM